MDNINEKISKLENKLGLLENQQMEFSREVADIRQELNKLRTEDDETVQQEVILEAEPITVSLANTPEKEEEAIEPISQSNDEVNAEYQAIEHQQQPPKSTSLEKFIGENLMNKIGIAITVIGIAIGTKYSIENNLISPLTRIILGYLCGIGLLLIGMKLRAKYENYSAVLVSGAMATMYFITFSAYSFFNLIPQTMTFALMVVFTIFTVTAALSYNKQVIAHIGLVGAYAIPFLLSNDSGNVTVLFSYMLIINAGILFVSLKKYWKQLYYVSFGLSWVIYFTWYITDFVFEWHLAVALTFASLFFLLFYATFLGYKLKQNEQFKKLDIVLLLTNSFIFYGIGYSILIREVAYEQLLGLFTLCNGIIHFAVGLIIHKKKLADKNLYYLVVGLVLVFVTISIPVQLDGSWVTLLWLCQAVLLYWIGRTKKVSLYEVMSYPLIIIAFFSLIQDWMMGYFVNQYVQEVRMSSFLNITFLTSVIAIAAYSALQYITIKNKTSLNTYPKISTLVNYTIPAILLIVIYYAFKMEISFYWDKAFVDSWISIKQAGNEYADQIKNYDINSFETIWLFNYTLLFTVLLFIVNIKKIKSTPLAYTVAAIAGLTIIIFLTHGIYTLGVLRDSYVTPINTEYYKVGFFHVGIRYISIALVACSIYAGYLSLRSIHVQNQIKIYLELFIHITILVIISNELITWLSIKESESAYKTTLSILFGIYALSLIVLGIIQKKQHLRISAISLFGVTLLKLFFYDLTNLSTIEKTIVFVSLGILLLVISFLYNKYKPAVNE